MPIVNFVNNSLDEVGGNPRVYGNLGQPVLERSNRWQAQVLGEVLLSPGALKVKVKGKWFKSVRTFSYELVHWLQVQLHLQKVQCPFG
uniref:Putative transposase n=1 Tax=Ixodes ricinus TaxID=34613 RepID=A0A0K8RE84_IXORI